jgi:hypothetical protein
MKLVLNNLENVIEEKQFFRTKGRISLLQIALFEAIIRPQQNAPI